jgi:hypothetical protein
MDEGLIVRMASSSFLLEAGLRSPRALADHRNGGHHSNHKGREGNDPLYAAGHEYFFICRSSVREVQKLTPGDRPAGKSATLSEKMTTPRQ